MLRTIVRKYPSLYFFWHSRSSNMQKLRAHPGFDLVLEGPPRTANTSSAYSLFYSNGPSFKLGHHLHVPAHIAYAKKHSIPCLVLLRNPLDSVASLMMRESARPVGISLNDHYNFTCAVETFREHLVLASFESIIESGLGPAIEIVNEKFGSSIVAPKGDGAEKQWVAERLIHGNQRNNNGNPETLSFPSEYKRKKATVLKHKIEEEMPRLLAKVQKKYLKVIESADY